jgi:hypothetical protein
MSYIRQVSLQKETNQKDTIIIKRAEQTPNVHPRPQELIDLCLQAQAF